jgi:hypothetical protein
VGYAETGVQSFGWDNNGLVVGGSSVAAPPGSIEHVDVPDVALPAAPAMHQHHVQKELTRIAQIHMWCTLAAMSDIVPFSQQELFRIRQKNHEEHIHRCAT